jgi:hypothetical protein
LACLAKARGAARWLQEVTPETALERALRDREDAAARLEAELRRERIQGGVEARSLQRRLDAVTAAARSAGRERDELRMALAAAEAAHLKECEARDVQERVLATEKAALQVRCRSSHDLHGPVCQLAAGQMWLGWLQAQIPCGDCVVLWDSAAGVIGHCAWACDSLVKHCAHQCWGAGASRGLPSGSRSPGQPNGRGVRGA